MVNDSQGPTDTTARLAALDHAHLWHPFTPMKQWRQHEPIIIERGEGFELIDTRGRRYIDGVSSLWCNVHGHNVASINDAVRTQLDRIAHSTLLGLASPPSIELAAKLVELAGDQLGVNALSPNPNANRKLNKVFYTDAGATAVEVAFKMAVGYWFHKGKPLKKKFIGFRGAYHGDTVGAMSVGFSDLFHRPFESMVFEVMWVPAPDICRLAPLLSIDLTQTPNADEHSDEASDQSGDHSQPQNPTRASTAASPHALNIPIGTAPFPSNDATLTTAIGGHCIQHLEQLLDRHAREVAAVVIEPVMQGAAGMICQPPGFVGAVRELCDKHDVLLIADEVATGFGRTGRMLACAHDGVVPDILCLAKGLTGGYLPVAATLCTDEIESAFCGELDEKKTLYHGHTYTGNALGCAAAIASLDLFEDQSIYPGGLQARIEANAAIIAEQLSELRDCPHVLDLRQRGLMVGIELCQDRFAAEGPRPFDFSKRMGAAVCDRMRERGAIVRPLGDVIVLMPAPGMPREVLERLLEIVVGTIKSFRPA